VSAPALPSDLAPLDDFAGVVLIDVPAGDLTLDQMAALREYVRSDGRGLVVTGGRSSFTLGAYKNTPLEEVLPVLMEPPPRPQRSDVTMLLIVDRSASMSGVAPSKFDMAKEAALLATESLRDEDRLGVLTFDTGPSWAVEFQQIGSGLSMAQIQNQIAGIEMGGGTDILAALQTGLPELAAQPGGVRHAVLLTDGRSFTNEYPRYRQLVEQARELDITLSAIAIGADSDTQLLQSLAEWGAGRYHFAAEPDDIPRLTMLESEIARSEPQIEGDFRASQTAPHPLLRDFPATTLPQLAGYVGTTLKPQAEIVLASPDDDPVLAVWQYGLGRAVAWTPSVEEPWAPNWSNWPEYGDFWAQIIRYVLPEPDGGLTQARVSPRGDEVTISVDARLPGGATLDLADTQATITLPDGATRTITLRQTGPGRYAENVGLPTDGAYSIEVVQQKDALRRQVSLGYAQPYPAELLPVRGGAALLEQISAVTGGVVLEPLVAGAAPVGVAEPAISAPEAFGLAPWLLLLAALLWPVEIAARRGWLRV
ncbi:MAG: VWA domain-containing protein, partial [Roseiflexaceae bacterium]|nr:VWA domain-containing protein [Roseiflexaceae bacterium]